MSFGWPSRLWACLCALSRVPGSGATAEWHLGPLGRVAHKWGRFQFANVPSGEYQLSVDAGHGLTPSMLLPVVVPYRKSCVETEIVLEPSGRISGRVVTADGTAGARIYVRLVPDGPAGSLMVQHVAHAQTTDAEGRFTFEGLDPDSYALAVNPDGNEATGRQPYAPAFFGGTDRASATRIPVTKDSRSSWIARSSCRRLWPHVRSPSP